MKIKFNDQYKKSIYGYIENSSIEFLNGFMNIKYSINNPVHNLIRDDVWDYVFGIIWSPVNNFVKFNVWRQVFINVREKYENKI